MIPQYEPHIKYAYNMAVTDQIRSGWIGYGKTTKEFEEKFAEYVEFPYASACSSGTAALIIALKACGLNPGDSVLVPAYGFIAAVNACRFLNLKPILVDINYRENSLSMDCDLAELYLSDFSGKIKPKAIIYVNHGGFVDKNLRGLYNKCCQKDVWLIEDCACALGCSTKVFFKVNGVKQERILHPGNYSHISTYSFSVPKILTTGQGGIVVTDNFELNQRSKEIIDQGSVTWREDGIHHSIGANFKFNDILAAYGLAQLNELKSILSNRADIYNHYLHNGIDLISKSETFSIEDSPWMNIYRTKDAKYLMEFLAKNDIQSKMYYKPIRWSYNPENKIYLEAEKAYFECLYLPSSLTLSLSNIDFICDKIKEFEGKN